MTPVETEGLPPLEITLLNGRTVIVDNKFGIKYTRYRHTDEKRKISSRRRLKVIALSDLVVELYESDVRRDCPPELVKDGYKVVPVPLDSTGKNLILVVGKYQITPEIAQNESGYRVLLRLDPHPMGHVIIQGHHTPEIGKELVRENKSQGE